MNKTIVKSLFFTIIQKPMERSYWAFVEGIRVMVFYRLAYKNMSQLYSIIAQGKKVEGMSLYMGYSCQKKKKNGITAIFTNKT